MTKFDYDLFVIGGGSGVLPFACVSTQEGEVPVPAKADKGRRGS